MDYVDATHILETDAIAISIKRANERNTAFWLDKGLNTEDIELLTELESNEDSYNTTRGYYMSRRYQLESDMISIEDVIEVIELYKKRKDEYMKSKYVSKGKSILNFINKEKRQLEEYWIGVGLTIEEIECLIQMEIEEDTNRGNKSYYLSRKWMYTKGLMGLADIKADIERWKRVNIFRLEWIG